MILKSGSGYSEQAAVSILTPLRVIIGNDEKRVMSVLLLTSFMRIIEI
jgi:hypothetical protein